MTFTKTIQKTGRALALTASIIAGLTAFGAPEAYAARGAAVGHGGHGHWVGRWGGNWHHGSWNRGHGWHGHGWHGRGWGGWPWVAGAAVAGAAVASAPYYY